MDMNLGSARLRVKVGPGLSERMRSSMIALYWTYGLVELFLRSSCLRMIEAAERAAVGEDSAESTMVGRWRTSEPASFESGLPEAQNAF